MCHVWCVGFGSVVVCGVWLVCLVGLFGGFVAVGSQGELGVVFGGLEGFDWVGWREFVGDDLLGGYGTLVFACRGRCGGVCERCVRFDVAEFG
jgi:hypothetical protein